MTDNRAPGLPSSDGHSHSTLPLSGKPADSEADTIACPGGSAGTPARRGSLSPGQCIGPYRIERLLGSGGMGEVYSAEHTGSGHRLAVKVLPSSETWSPELRERFFREGRLAARINHPNSLYVYETAEANGTPLIAMELAPGGTLQDRVEAEGPLPVRAAVDAILQVIAGLEAAYEAGILHRDVKPANCFVDRDGSVKIGDYGLSLPTASAADTRLTMMGTIMGTPAYAPPEQLRGEDVDVRADIYAVGATLFNLLTARIPLPATGAVQMLAAVLERVPESPRKFRPEIPRGLAEAVLRCLEKKPADRFQTYTRLRQELVPFSSAVPLAARPGIRFGAGCVDWLLLALVFMLVSAWAEGIGMRTNIYELLVFVVIGLVYAIPEVFWSRSPGKGLTGLRLAQPGGQRPDYRRVLLRTAVYLSPCTLVVAAGEALPEQSAALGVIIPLAIIAPLLPFLPWDRGARQRGWHDRLSGTMVVQAKTGVEAARVHVQPPLPGDRTRPYSIGPYRVSSDPAQSRPGVVLDGFDSSLRRGVWIVVQPDGAPPTPAARRDLSRAARLRWLNGRRSPEFSWDAYEAIEGTPLLIAGPQLWGSVRLWLSDLVNEIVIPQTGDAPPPALSLDRVWLASSGHAVLLEFPAPGLAAGSSDQPPTTYDPGDPHAVQGFLYATAGAAMGAAPSLSPRPDPARSAAASPVPLPLHAFRFLQDLSGRRFGSTRQMADTLASMRDRDTRLRRSRIALKLALVAGPSLVLAALSGVVVMKEMKALDARSPGLLAAKWCLAQLTELKDASTSKQAERREALEAYLAGPLRSAIGDTTATLSEGGRRRWVDAEAASRWARILASRAEPSPEMMSRARALLVPEMNRDLAGVPPGIVSNTAIVLLTLTGALAILLAGILRGGLLLRAFGIAVVRRDGGEVGRARALARAIVSWSPALVCWTPVVFHEALFTKLFSDPSTPTFAIPWLMFLVGAGWSLLCPQWGLADRLAGTYLVPR